MAAAPVQPTPPQPHGTRQQYCHSVRTNIGRDENWIAHGFYVFLLWILVLGGLALLAWLGYGMFQLGHGTAPHAMPPAVSAPVAPAPPASRPATRSRPSPTVPPATRPAAPQQVQVSGSLDLVHHEAQTATQPAPANRRPTPEELDEATARWLEGQRDP